MNQPIYTHYDNLKVARNAPPEVIRAAYKTLSQKFHPDRSQNDPDAARIMSIINASYQVLSDPVKKAEHDRWINSQEAANSPSMAQTQKPLRPAPTLRIVPKQPLLVRFFRHIFRNFSLYFFVGFIGGVLIYDELDRKEKGASPSKPYQSSPTAAQKGFERPATAPNGAAWPAGPSYISGYPKLHTQGLSSVTVDNTRNDSDVFVKLVSLSGAQAYPVRHLYIPAFSSFTLNKINAGQYDIRYRDLTTGGLSRSEPFDLEEISSFDGTQYSNMTMTLYKVQNGNMQTYGLNESEF